MRLPTFCLTLAISLSSSALLADDDICLACHDDPGLEQIEGGVPISLYVSGDMLGQSVHSGVSCTDCHHDLEGVEDFPHAENLAGVNCAGCHDAAFKVYMSGFRDHLQQRGFTAIPGCTNCHGTHRISQLADTRAVCGICHSEERRGFDRSAHSVTDGAGKPLVSCTSCHAAHDKSLRGRMLPSDWRLSMVSECLKCHDAQSRDYLKSRHFQQVKSGNMQAPICVDCHAEHELYSIKDPRSNVHIDKLDATCDRCHPGHASTIHRKSGVDPRLMTCVACHTGHQTEMDRVQSAIFKETLPFTCNRCHASDRHSKENLAHGKIMVMTANKSAANCTECHLYHWNLPDPDIQAEAQRRLACKNCHSGENLDYERSAHGIAYRKGHTEAPTCITCHGDREVERISKRFTGQTILSLCSSCHANREVTMKFQLNDKVVSGYLNTYHGKMYSLGYQGSEFATCVSCHDNHRILPSDNPQSTISKQHIIQTCGRCHSEANENFVAMLQHYDPMMREENPTLSGIHTFMVWLLGVTLSVFGVHTLLWLGRSVFDRIKHGRGLKPSLANGARNYMRFGLYSRITHGLVIVSFLTLAMTGLPLKYSHTALAQWIANHIFTLHTMAILHRIAAVMTFTYFAMHLGGLGVKLATRKISLQRLVWGPDSLVPQPRDIADFIKHIGYFIGVADKPRFGKWAYWEKFDYFAVFWGVAMIGLSGLTLWFPTLFTRLLPGWAINAAHIIHSEEALLATGFIFTVHFFNVHLRPETFPFDEVIFTGRLNERLLMHERPLWFESLKRENKLESLRAPQLQTFARVVLYVFGFLALGIGLSLLALIVVGTFF